MNVYRLGTAAVIALGLVSSGFAATTIVRVVVGFRLASRLFMRCSAWLLSHDCATNTASRPNSTANAIITMVLVRTRLPSFDARILAFLTNVSEPLSRYAGVELVK